MTTPTSPDIGSPLPVIHTACVGGNRPLCREHYRLTICVQDFESADPGQFVHLRPATSQDAGYVVHESAYHAVSQDWMTGIDAPLLRRAFSIAGLQRRHDGCEIDVIYRVVGTATRWMETLHGGDRISLMGPLGNRFPIHPEKRNAWLIAGGVGLPPMLWLAEALARAGKSTVAFCGAQSADLLPLSWDPSLHPSSDATQAAPCSGEFSVHNTGVVVSTDDGSLGYHGHIGSAMVAYHQANKVNPDDLVVYTCGPERMMALVARHCAQHGIQCHVCMERAMACGTGLCQSCVVPVHEDTDPEGWRYRLCCTHGPVFQADRIVWEPLGGGDSGGGCQQLRHRGS